MNTVIVSEVPSDSFGTRRRTTLTKLPDGYRSKVLPAAIAAMALLVASPLSAFAGDTDKAKEIGKTTLDILGNASKKANKVSKAIQILEMVKTANNPCGCAKSIIAAIYQPFKDGTTASAGFEYATAVAKCFGFQGLPGSQAQELDKAVQALWTRMSKNRTKSIRFLRKIESERRKACVKKKVVNQTAFYYDPANREDGDTLLAGLGDYRLPGSEPVAVGDLDGDGRNDIVVGDPDGDTIVVLLAEPGGGFRIGQTLAAGVQPAFVYLDDVDRDGSLDAVVLNRGSEDGSLFLGNGDGTVRDEVIFDAARGGQSTLEVDVDGDTTPDRVSVTEVPGHVSVGLGPLDGFHDTFFDYPAGEMPDAVSPVDIDVDGIVDLIVRDIGSSAVAVFYGLGNGVFQAPFFYLYEGSAVGGFAEFTADKGDFVIAPDPLLPDTPRFPATNLGE